MEKNLCTVCLKSFSNNSNLTRHVKNIHGDRGKKDVRREVSPIANPGQGETGEFELPKQSGGMYVGSDPSPDLFSTPSDNDIVSRSECVANDDVNVSGSEFLDRSDVSSPDTSRDFCGLDIWGIISKWYGGKTGKQKLQFILNRVFKLTLLSRALFRDDILKSIMQTVEYFQNTFHMGFDEALEHAVLKRRFLIRDILAVSDNTAENSMDCHTSDKRMATSDSSDDKNDTSAVNIWEMTNTKMNNENVSGTARTKRSLEYVLFCLQHDIAWRRDSIYKAIMVSLKKAQAGNRMTFQKALKHAIHQNRYKIRKKLVERDDDYNKQTKKTLFFKKGAV